MNDRIRVAVIGAGPVGIETALEAIRRGHEVDVYEAGRIAENVRRWGHVRLFSPFAMNSTAASRDDLGKATREPLPDPDSYLAGRDYADRYLIPLSRLPTIRNRIRENSSVVAVGRSRLSKGQLIGNRRRTDEPFRLLIRDNNGERNAEADVVIDCSGTYRHHRRIGAGGLACLGESALLTGMDYELSDISGDERSRYADRTTLVVGSGYSAATAIEAIASVAQDAPQTRAIWLTHGDRSAPIGRIENDSLPERDRLAARANELATGADGPIQWLPGHAVVRLARQEGDSRIAVEVESESAARTTLRVDRVLGLVGYRPDNRLYEELQVHECYASQGTMKLAAALLGETSADCLDQTGHGVDVLRNPEPNFFVIGAKSYGRNSRFLMQIGFGQVHDVFSIIDADRKEPA